MTSDVREPHVVVLTGQSEVLLSHKRHPGRSPDV